MTLKTQGESATRGSASAGIKDRTRPHRAGRRRSTHSAPVDVYERIWSAIMDHSLPPETRLVEERLCETFGIGRTRLRQVLQRLAHEGVVTLVPHRGAIVSRPSVRESREIFAARRLIEGGIVEAFLESATPASIERLREHLGREVKAARTGDRRAMLVLSGEFHLVLAESVGNSILLEMLRDLISRSSLIIAVYQAPEARSCEPDEHRELVAALERRDRRAIRMMLAHLDHLFAGLQLTETPVRSVDLSSVFADVLA